MDEVFSLEGSQVDFGCAVTGNDDAHARIVVLDDADPVYSRIRDLNFAKVGPALKRQASALGASYDEIRAAETGEWFCFCLCSIKIYSRARVRNKGILTVRMCDLLFFLHHITAVSQLRQKIAGIGQLQVR